MVTDIRKGSKQHLYIEEHIFARGLSYEDVGLRMGVSRTTVWRWAHEQNRLSPGKIAGLAEALQMDPTEFYRMPTSRPGRPSLDALLQNADDDDFETALELAKRLARRRSH